MQTALVIEDTENNMALICFILEQAGYATLRAENGRTGLSMAATLHPDFIILDIQLPDIMGTEVLTLLRENPVTQRIPVIAMTSYAMAGDREKLLAAGCNGYIEKPIDPAIVIGQIRKIIDK